MTALVVVLLPVAGVVALTGLRDRPRPAAVVAVSTLVATAAAAAVTAEAEPEGTWAWGGRLELTVAVEGFGRVMTVLVPAVAAPVVAYGAVTVVEGRTRLLALLVAFVAAMELLVIAADLLTLLIAWELIGAISWALIAHEWRQPGNAAAAAQAFVVTHVGDLGLYLAAGVTFAATGGFRFADIAAADRPELALIAGGVLLAAAAKSAQLPFSPWLFSAMAGPTPVSALLHSATLVAAGAYLLVRLAPAFAPVPWFDPVVAALGAATAIAGGVVGVVHGDAKRVLAASTSAQYGLMFVAIAAGSTAAAASHLVTHALFKSLLFLAAGVAIHAAGTGQLAAMRLGRSLPRVAALSAIGALALAAVPPLGGAWSKEHVAAAALHTSSWLAAGVFTASLLSVVYAARFQLLAYGPGRPTNAGPLPHRPGRVEVASMVVLAAATLGVSALWLPGGGRIVERLADATVVSPTPWELGVSVVVVAIGSTVAWVLWRSGRLADLGVPEQRPALVADWLAIPTVGRVAVVQSVLALARVLARLDDRVVDAGVRVTAWLADALARLVSRRVEWSVDGVVRAVAGLTMASAAGARAADEHAVDGAVEGTAGLVLAGGRASRRPPDRSGPPLLPVGHRRLGRRRRRAHAVGLARPESNSGSPDAPVDWLNRFGSVSARGAG